MAIENATRQLFAEQEFVARLTYDEQKQEKGFFDNLLSYLVSDDSAESGQPAGVGNRFVVQAHAANAFSEINVLKIGALEYFMMQGEWPTSTASST